MGFLTFLLSLFQLGLRFSYFSVVHIESQFWILQRSILLSAGSFGHPASVSLTGRNSSRWGGKELRNVSGGEQRRCYSMYAAGSLLLGDLARHPYSPRKAGKAPSAHLPRLHDHQSLGCCCYCIHARADPEGHPWSSKLLGATLPGELPFSISGHCLLFSSSLYKAILP